MAVPALMKDTLGTFSVAGHTVTDTAWLVAPDVLPLLCTLAGSHTLLSLVGPLGEL